jgi:hypothetical protein
MIQGATGMQDLRFRAGDNAREPGGMLSRPRQDRNSGPCWLGRESMPPKLAQLPRATCLEHAKGALPPCLNAVILFDVSLARSFN